MRDVVVWRIEPWNMDHGKERIATGLKDVKR